jgi:uncharacterized membrane protein YkoI
MRKFRLPLLIVLLGSALAFAAGLISKQAAEKEALGAVGGGSAIHESRAKQIALAAVGDGKVISTRLEKKDNPVDWSVDIRATNGKDYEVKVDACTGKVLQIIVGG